MLDGILLVLAGAVGGVLYRLRGGALKTWLRSLKLSPADPFLLRWFVQWAADSTQLSRLVWAAPTAVLVAELVDVDAWWLGSALGASVFLSMALLGHGAHMVFGPAYWRLADRRSSEVVTGWLAALFGAPAPDWGELEVDLFNAIGMSTIGVVRNAIAIAPAAIVAPLPAALYILAGASHGPLYWLGWRVTPDICAGEVLVGASSWVVLAVSFGRF